MSKYLVVDFNRYDTNRSGYEHYEATSVDDLIGKMALSYVGDCVETKGDLLSNLEIVDEIFSCIPGEENDILIYKI